MTMRRSRRRPRLVVTLAATLLAVALAPAAASAHALLEGTSPQRGATLAQQPRTVTLRFSESVEGNFGAVRVFDASARRVDDGHTIHPGGQGSQLAVGLQPGLPHGTYVATYRVISADSHPVSGGLVFSVGKPGAAAAPTVSDLIGKAGAGPVTQAAFGLARGLDYLATALLLGGLAFLLAVWLPALRRSAAPHDAWHGASAAFLRRLRRLLLGAMALGVASGIAGIVLQGATAAATDAWAAIDPSVIGEVLGTRFGHVWGLRVLAFVILGAAAWLALRAMPEPGATPALQRVALGADGLAAPGPPRAALLLGLAPAAYIAIAPALGGHASVTSPVALLVSLDVLHVLAMSVWIGGLVVLLGVLPAATRQLPAPERAPLLAAVLVRFSPIALVCVTVLLVTGTVQALQHMSAWSQLLHTGFGRAVLIKVGLLALLVGLGATNRRRVLPRLRELAATAAAPGAAGRLLRRTLRAEVALVVAVLAVTAALVSYPPPDTLASGPFDGTARLGPLPAKAREAGPGHYVVDTVQLVPGGDWRLHVTSRVSDFDQYDTTLKVPVRRCVQQGATP